VIFGPFFIVILQKAAGIGAREEIKMLLRAIDDVRENAVDEYLRAWEVGACGRFLGPGGDSGQRNKENT
jgi:hypothetical protein